MLTEKQINIIGAQWHFNLLCREDKNDIYGFARSIEALVRAECVPPGHVVVPVEPTRTQIMAAHDGPLAAGEYTITAETEEWLIEMYKAMLAAAPSITAPTAKD